MAVWNRTTEIDYLPHDCTDVLMYSCTHVLSHEGLLVFSCLAGMDAALRPMVNITCARGAAEQDH